MSTTELKENKRINLRRPDIMDVVQQQVRAHYRSELVDLIRANNHELHVEGTVLIKLAKEFGFCYGVERAIDLAYAARKVFPEEPIYILGEIIHNPDVNDQIKEMGIKFLSGTHKEVDIDDLKSGDIVIIPAFGTEVSIRKKLEDKGCRFVDTTCGDVMSVWKRVRQYSRENVTSIIHGKAYHEETMATSSQAMANQGHYLVVLTLEETDYVCNYIKHGGNKVDFLEKFKGAYSTGFDPDLHLSVVGVANQTTMMRGETEEVQNRIREAIRVRFGEDNLKNHFRFFDTICGATQERQDALKNLLNDSLDFLLVIGGYNSSNTSHLAEMGESVLPTYFIKNAAKIVSEDVIVHFDQHKLIEIQSKQWLPKGKIKVGITAGASCPNNLIEDVVRRLLELKGVSPERLLENQV